MKRTLNYLHLVYVIIGATYWGMPLAVQGDALSDFEAGRQAYENQEYAKAIALFKGILDDDEAIALNPLVALETRKYFAASYLFLQKPEQARAQFEALLKQDPEYDIDPLSFPKEVVQLFSQVREATRAERAQALESKRKNEEHARRQRELQKLREKQRLLQLQEMAATEVVIERNSRWLAAIPFGVGQFQNGHDGLGIFFAVSEASLVVLGATSFFLHASLRNENPADSNRDEARRAERAFRYTNWVSVAALVTVMSIGVVDAQLRFVPFKRTRRRRNLPAALQKEPALSLSLRGPSLELLARF